MAVRERPDSTLSKSATVRLAAAGLSLIAVCYGLARFAYGLFVPAFRNAFDLDATMAGTIASSSYVAYAVGVIAATAATPRAGARVVAALAGCLATAGTALIAIAPDALVLTIGVVIAGSSTGVASPPLAHAVARRVAPHARDRTQTIVNAGTGLGVMISGPIALLAQQEWRIAWLAFAAIAAAVTVWTLLAVPVARDSAAAGPRPASAPRRQKPGRVVPLLVAAAAMGAASAAGWTFGQDLLTTVGGHDHDFSTLAWIVLGACGLLGAGAGDLATRLGVGRAWSILMAAMSTSLVALAAMPQHPVVAIVASAVFGAVYIALTGLLLVWSTQVFEAEPSRGVGTVFLVLALGQAAASPVLGFLGDLAGLPAAFWASAVLALIGALIRPPSR